MALFDHEKRVIDSGVKLDVDHIGQTVRSWTAEWTIVDCREAMENESKYFNDVSPYGFALVMSNMTKVDLDVTYSDKFIEELTGYSPSIIRKLQACANNSGIEKRYLKHCGPVTITEVGEENMYVLRHWNNRRHFIKLID